MLVNRKTEMCICMCVQSPHTEGLQRDVVKSMQPITPAWVKLKALYYAYATGIKYRCTHTSSHYVLNIGTAR